ncbi:hypothetical protein Tco_0878690 [Tanacetum coccineum]|uniref:Uncharacterized protein n=1 Tax=Tanacetum coccineum TaxID=301880 RepID=A0ABQ5C0G6_9ASTR
MRNIVVMATLLAENLLSYQRIWFTNESKIIKINEMKACLGCKKGRADFILNNVIDQKTLANLLGTNELSLAAATVTILETSTLPKAAKLNSVPAISTTKMPEMSTPPKIVEVKNVPRIMKTTDATVSSAKRSYSEHLVKDSCGLKVKVPKQESSTTKQIESL